ncbi:hypothetical protein CkaCkLH20_12567 [Colletotrichum karsti]|uniref:F-box domain-containing protein n=1 Tax=Colletotrichum karsti TaxID=1095194 RepID=A0A9P6HSY0_9PEZI|nr:uncharacterized protein CkaCkLH20_12567 [Colletotrichum karsti]KAF9869958.1 hypothetical protein CkaCkLH20_12567 [Colletotrichum karsti]
MDPSTTHGAVDPASPAPTPARDPETLPSELFSKILGNLDLASAKELRLSSKSLAEKCLGPEFTSHFAHQKTDLSASSLEGLAALASHKVLAPAVSHLTVLSTTFDLQGLTKQVSTKRRTVTTTNGPIFSSTEERLTEEELKRAEDELAWCRAQIEEREKQTDESVIDSLASSLKAFEKLDTLDIEGAVSTDMGSGSAPPHTIRDWQSLWVRNTKVFRLVMLAIARSGVPVKTLTVFRSTNRCSVPAGDVTALLPQLDAEPNAAVALGAVENFAISVSTPVQLDAAKIDAKVATLEGIDQVWHRAFGSNTGQFSAADPEASADENFPGVAGLLGRMPNLEAFDVHLYSTLTNGLSEAWWKMFARIADEVELPRLEQVMIRGLPAREDELLTFLRKHHGINELMINEMSLESGRWQPVFDYFAKATALTKLHLANLFDGGYVVSLELAEGRDIGRDPDPRDYFPCTGGPSKVFKRSFEEETIRAGLVFKDEPMGRPLGSPQLMWWRNKRKADFGPP